jgi:hypothetical protein
MDWLIESVKADPIKFLSMLISAVALGVAASSLLTSRQSMKTAKRSLETAQKALGATHLPNIGLDLRFEPHKEPKKTDKKHLQFFFENRGEVTANDLVGAITISHEGTDSSFKPRNIKKRVEPNDEWPECFQKTFVKTCLELAPNVFEAGQEETDIKLRLGVPNPKIGIVIELVWESPGYRIGRAGFQQSWELKPKDFSDDRRILDWECQRVAEELLDASRLTGA